MEYNPFLSELYPFFDVGMRNPERRFSVNDNRCTGFKLMQKKPYLNIE